MYNCMTLWPCEHDGLTLCHRTPLKSRIKAWIVLGSSLKSIGVVSARDTMQYKREKKKKNHSASSNSLTRAQ